MIENHTVAQKLEVLVALQDIDTKLDQIKKLRGDLPEQIQAIEDQIVGYKTRMDRFKNEVSDLEDKEKNYKEDIKKHEALIKKYQKQQDDVKNNREYNAIIKELELQELEIQICKKYIKEGNEDIKIKKEDVKNLDEKLIIDCEEDLETKKKELEQLFEINNKEEQKLNTAREKVLKKADPKLLKYYERLRCSLSNGLAVVRVVKGAAEGCNIIVPPQKIAEIREKKKIVIDEHSGRILADVKIEPKEEVKKTRKKSLTTKKAKKKIE